LVGGIIARKSSRVPDYAQQLYELCGQLKIDDRVRWTGEYPWDSDEGSVYLRAADLCVLPFDSGVNLNNSSFAAAAAHGLPVVTTQGKFLDQPLVHQQNVYLCPPKNPEALGAAIVTLMDRPEIRERLRIGALELAREWYTWDKAIERTLATLS
jgi:glycosyltransferase involved in cell wall biosynthesis